MRKVPDDQQTVDFYKAECLQLHQHPLKKVFSLTFLAYGCKSEAQFLT